MGYVFISYSTKNQRMADSLRDYLNKEHVETWMAPGDIPPGSRYAQVINKAVKDCACFVLLLSDHSQNSEWVPKEVERAVNFKKAIIPIEVEKTVLNDEFQLYISTNQIIKVKKIDGKSPEIKQFMSTVKAAFEKDKSELSDDDSADKTESLKEDKTKTGQKKKYIIIAAVLSVFVIAAVVLTVVLSGGSKPLQKSESSSSDSLTTEKQIESWRTAYMQYLMSHIDDMDPQTSKFLFVYIDNDSVPELIVSPDNCHATPARLLTYYNGVIIDLGKHGEYGSVSYIEKEGIISDEHGSNNGRIYDTVFMLENGELSKLFSGYYDIDYDSFENNVYYLYNQEVSEEEYNESRESIFNGKELKSNRNSGTGERLGLDLTEENIRKIETMKIK